MKEINTKQNEVIISLLGRIAFPEEKLQVMIVKRKRNPEAYLRGYNACNGKNSVTDIANIVGVSQPTMTTILQSWENLGIIYETESLRGKNYVALYPLSLKEISQRKEAEEIIEGNQESPTVSESPESQIKSTGGETDE